jgi:membrane protease YdiL (CAAX protease family)
MQAVDLAFTTPDSAPHWKRWIVYSPLARIVIFAAMFTVFAIGMAKGIGLVAPLPRSPTEMQLAIANFLIELVPAVLAYLVLVRMIEKRDVAEFSPSTMLLRTATGVAGGSILFSAVVGVLWIAGSYHVTGFNAHPAWVPELLVAGVTAGIAEEIMLRGVLFRIAEEGLGTWWALAISAAVFGALHLNNHGATVWSSAAIAIEAGLLLAMIYHVTRSLWTCAGLHAAWNIMQGAVYGIPVSGTHADGFFVSTRTGPDWLSGGEFGAEASVVALALCSIVTIALLKVALRRGSIVSPSWKRSAATAT